MRWKIVSRPTVPAMAGASWNPVAPAPIITTSLPARSTPWSQRAVWKAGPAKSAAPGSSGTNGWLSWPTALITARARRVSAPSGPDTVTAQVALSSSHAAEVTVVSNRMFPATPWRCITSSK